MAERHAWVAANIVFQTSGLFRVYTFEQSTEQFRRTNLRKEKEMNLLEEQVLDKLWDKMRNHELNALGSKNEFLECYDEQPIGVQPDVPFGCCRQNSKEPLSNENIQFVLLDSAESKSRTIGPVWYVEGV